MFGVGKRSVLAVGSSQPRSHATSRLHLHTRTKMMEIGTQHRIAWEDAGLMESCTIVLRDWLVGAGYRWLNFTESRYRRGWLSVQP